MKFFAFQFYTYDLSHDVITYIYYYSSGNLPSHLVVIRWIRISPLHTSRCNWRVQVKFLNYLQYYIQCILVKLNWSIWPIYWKKNTIYILIKITLKHPLLWPAAQISGWLCPYPAQIPSSLYFLNIRRDHESNSKK